MECSTEQRRHVVARTSVKPCPRGRRGCGRLPRSWGP
jgi:hypothetical protein